VLVSAGRRERPWQGGIEPAPVPRRPRHDPDCYLCPTNERVNGRRNPDFKGTFVFTNDFSALHPDTPEGDLSDHPLLRAHGQAGTCRVLCFSPRHDLDLAEMPEEDVAAVVELWTEQFAELGPRYRWIQVFENRGASMGASNPHPHGQLWASNLLPDEPAQEDRAQRSYHADRRQSLLVEYAALESQLGQRIVVENDGWVAVVPFWAVWPFETLVIPRRRVPRFTALDAAERRGLASLLRRLLARLDNLFAHPFPYSMGWHGAPGAVGNDAHWQLHAHFYPPLLRSATVRKFMVGYEMLADAQRDITPEEAAGRLRALSEVHFRSRELARG
jgi:UDPglucose--hexose-1-phosphate uridylyltransferase